MDAVDKIYYFLKFIYYKLRIPSDTRKGTFWIIYSEFIHLVNTILKTDLEMPYTAKVAYVETIFGKYYLIGDLYSYQMASPAFERPDIEKTIEIIKKTLLNGKNVLFLDIGANNGLYTIAIRKVYKSSRLKVHAFEPDSGYYELLKRNLKMNRVKGVVTHKRALGSIAKKYITKEFEIYGQEVTTKKISFNLTNLDNIFSTPFYKKFDMVFLNIDIEGQEKTVLSGARNLFESKVPIIAHVEDCVDESIIQELKKRGFKFMYKLTPYNSFWERL